jgi:hypothetical protein
VDSHMTENIHRLLSHRQVNVFVCVQYIGNINAETRSMFDVLHVFGRTSRSDVRRLYEWFSGIGNDQLGDTLMSLDPFQSVCLRCNTRDTDNYVVQSATRDSSSEEAVYPVTIHHIGVKEDARLIQRITKAIDELVAIRNALKKETKITIGVVP